MPANSNEHDREFTLLLPVSVSLWNGNSKLLVYLCIDVHSIWDWIPAVMKFVFTQMKSEKKYCI